jgi:glycosyltransferase involved in cell wall biosynthesis
MPSRRTILINHLLEPPNRITGITRYLFALLPELLKRDSFDYMLLTAWDKQHLPSDVINSSARIMTRRYHHSLPKNVLAQMAILPILVRQTNAALEFNCNPIGCFWPAWPRIITLHDMYFNVLPEKYQRRHRLWWQVLFPATLASSSHTICVSENTRNDLRRFYPRLGSKASVVHEASTLGPQPTPAPSLKTELPYALYVGNISPNKSPEVLVRGLELLQADGRDYRVYHVGSDDAGLLARALAGSQVRVSVHSLGRLTDAELAAAYSNATCLIVTSTYEGFCLPILEAQSLGKPVVCSDLAVLREVAGRGASYFTPGDPIALAESLKSLFDDFAYRENLSQSAHENAARFSWATAAAEIDALFAHYSCR